MQVNPNFVPRTEVPERLVGPKYSTARRPKGGPTVAESPGHYEPPVDVSKMPRTEMPEPRRDHSSLSDKASARDTKTLIKTVGQDQNLEDMLMGAGYREREIYGAGGALSSVMNANPNLRNPNLVFPGQRLRIPLK